MSLCKSYAVITTVSNKHTLLNPSCKISALTQAIFEFEIKLKPVSNHNWPLDELSTGTTSIIHFQHYGEAFVFKALEYLFMCVKYCSFCFSKSVMQGPRVDRTYFTEASKRSVITPTKLCSIPRTPSLYFSCIYILLETC